MKPRYLSLTAALVFCFSALAPFLAPERSQGQDVVVFPRPLPDPNWPEKRWIGADGVWWDDVNWDPAGQPTTEKALLTPSDAISRTVTYRSALDPVPMPYALFVGATGGGTIALAQERDTLSVFFGSYVGWTGSGVYRQSGGTHSSLEHGLVVGWGVGSNGLYELSGGILSMPQNVTVGFFGGSGAFVHSDGTASTAQLDLGVFPDGDEGGAGSYTLSGAGVLSTQREHVGAECPGTFTFTQNGGTNTASEYVLLGYYFGSRGVYNLTSGSLSAKALYLGWNGTGSLTQGGGEITLDQDLILGHSLEAAAGDFTLDGGTLSVGRNEYLGRLGSGTFTQNGGTHSVTTTLCLGLAKDTVGTYRLTDGGLSSQFLRVGSQGSGTFIQDGGQNTVTSQMSIGVYEGSSGTYQLNGGELVRGSLFLGQHGTGLFIQTGGTHTAWGGTQIGYDSGVSGEYRLVNGTYSSSSSTTVGYGGRGTFLHNQGDVTTGSLLLGGLASGEGSYYMDSGSLRVASAETVGSIGTGRFVQSGGDHSIGGRLTIAANLDLSHGTFDLSGGTLAVGPQGIVNNGTLTVSGGVLSSEGVIANNGTFNFTGGDISADITNNADGHVLLTGGGTRTIDGEVNNSGNWKVHNTDDQYTGSFVNSGVYDADPGDHHFTDLVVSPTGYLVAGEGDRFFISGDLENHSTQQSLWNTRRASLVFIGAGLHRFFLPGPDQGLVGMGGWFAWDRLDLAGGEVSLLDGNPANEGTSLYVGELLGATVSGSTITNLSGNGVRVYYHPNLPGNQYLAGLSYSLADGGTLAPAVPEPAAYLMILTGLAAVWTGWRGGRVARPERLTEGRGCLEKHAPGCA